MKSHKILLSPQTSRVKDGGATGPGSPELRRRQANDVKLCVRLSRQTMEWRDTAKQKGQQHDRPRNLVGYERALVPMDSKTTVGLPEATPDDKV